MVIGQESPFGDLLRRQRQAAGLTQAELAERAGLSVRGIADLERGARHHPRKDTVALLADALGLPPGDRTLLLAAARPATAAREVQALPDLPADPPRHETLDRHAHNLPVQLTSFVGREHEIAEISRLLATTRLVTLTGPGGCGKTRLGLRVGAELLARYPDGVWLVELAPLADPDLVPQAVATTVGVREEAGRPPVMRLADHLHDKRQLLIVDNCEHLLAACAELADALLHACPQLTVLATSREALGLAGERLFRVPSLSLPEDGRTHSIAQMATSEAVRLLVERATAVQPPFTLTNENVGAVAQICQRLDGIPLALELAAARIRVLTMEQIAQRLDDRFRLLTGGSRTALPRQQTLRALIDWSYDLLPEGERTLLRRLAVFAGGWTLEAAEGVCCGNGLEQAEVLDMLSRLIDKSLVLVEERQHAARYALLETMREYAGAKLLEAGEADLTRDRHLAWFLALAEEAQSHAGTMELYVWAPRLATEYDNLRTALEWSRAQPAETELELRLAAAMMGAWLSFGHHTAGRAALGRALERGTTHARTQARARALTVAGQMAAMQMDFVAAVALNTECLAIYRELDDKREIVYPLVAMAVLAMHRGDDGTARSIKAETTALAQQAGMTWMLALARYIWANAALEVGAYASARDDLEASVALFRELGDLHMAASPLNGLARLACLEGDYATARALVEECLATRRREADRWNVAIALNSLGEVARCEGDNERAEPLFEEALALNREISDRAGIAWSLHNLAHVALQAGEPRRAAMLFAESLTIRAQHDYKVGIASSLAGMAGVALRQERAERAVWLFGAVEAVLTSVHGVLAPADKLVYDRDVAAVRTQLDEATFTAAWNQGRTMLPREAIAEALAVGK